MEDLKDDTTTTRGSEANGNHSLGLQDLYKAAFSQVKEETGERYQISYSLKEDLTFPGQTVECYTTNTSLTSYEVYEVSQSNSVLDLDKGIPVEVVKQPPDGITTYNCDNQILNRYLQEAALYKEETELSNPSSDSLFLTKPVLGNGEHDSSQLELHCIEDSPGINLDQGLKMEDCDFNSSDSFASTESIIPKSVKCPKCSKMFMFKSDLTRHNRHKHAQKPRLTCTVCSKEFPSQQNLLFHERSHKKSPSEMVCRVCQRVFKKPAAFSKHMLDKHQDLAPYRCPQCPNFFANAELLKDHRRDIHGPMLEATILHPCDKCGKLFESMQALVLHVKSHGRKTYGCDLCGKTFCKPSSLKVHAKKHLPVDTIVIKELDPLKPSPVGKPKASPKEPIFKCEHCPKAFGYKRSYNLHIKKHIFPKTCQVCGSAFETSSDLTKHLRLHNGERCHLCSQVFASNAALTEHNKAVHKTTTQETYTQTGEDLYELQNVVVDPSLTETHSILLTPLSNFNSVPFIIAQPQTVPYSASSQTVPCSSSS